MTPLSPAETEAVLAQRVGLDAAEVLYRGLLESRGTSVVSIATGMLAEIERQTRKEIL